MTEIRFQKAYRERVCCRHCGVDLGKRHSSHVRKIKEWGGEWLVLSVDRYWCSGCKRNRSHPGTWTYAYGSAHHSITIVDEGLRMMEMGAMTLQGIAEALSGNCGWPIKDSTLQDWRKRYGC